MLLFVSVVAADVVVVGVAVGVVRVEQQVEILGRLRQEEALHPVLQRVGQHVLDGGVPAGCPGGVLDGAEDVEAGVYEPGVARGAVQVHDALYQLRPQRVTLPVSRHTSCLELRSDFLYKYVVAYKM